MPTETRVTRILATLLFLLATTPLLAGTALTAHEATYKVKISVVSGQLNTELSATEDGYVATHAIKPTGMSRMFSRGRILETSKFVATPSSLKARIRKK